jgi:hypothetical protein
MKRLVIAFGLTGLLALGFVAACKQSEGERCQVDDDCEDPLVCAQATQTCADNDTSSGIDAMAPMDAPDAMVDAFVFLDAP